MGHGVPDEKNGHTETQRSRSNVHSGAYEENQNYQKKNTYRKTSGSDGSNLQRN